MVPNNYTLGLSISNSQGGANHPPWEDMLQKKAQEDEG